MGKSSGTAQPAEQIEVFEKGERAEAADFTIDAGSNKNTGIAVAEAEQTKPRIDSRKLSRSARCAIESQAEVAAHNRIVLKRFRDFVEGIRWSKRVGVNEPEHVSRCLQRGGVHLRTTPPRSFDDCCAVRSGQ